MKKRMLYFALAISLMLALLPMGAQASSISGSISGDVTWNDGDEISSAVSISGDTNITVNGTVHMSAGISITDGQVTLSGGGTLLREGTGFNMIDISGGSLTLNSITLDGDEVENTGLGINAQTCTVTMNSGCMIKNHWKPSNKGDGSAIYLGSGAKFTMNGGEISGCQSQNYGGAVYMDGYSTFTMEGGKVQNNQTLLANATYGGGAFYVRRATLTINDGSISGNSSAVGGAIYNTSYGTTVINGGNISSNSSAVGGAIYHSCRQGVDSVLKISGNANIATDNDIYLSSSTSVAKYLEITAALRNALKLTIVDPSDGRLVAQGSDYALTLNDMAKLQTGNTGFVLNLNDNNQIVLATTAAEYPVYLGYDANGGVGAPTGVSASVSSDNPSVSVTISSETPSRNKYSFLGWATDKNATAAEYYAGNLFTLTGNATLYAVWVEAIPDAPPAVTLSARADSYIEVSNIRAGCEYVVTTGSTAPDSWPTSGTNYYKATADGAHTFTGLSADTQYYIFGRVAETAENNASPSSEALSVTTKSALSGVSVSMSGYTYGGTPSTPSLSGYSGSDVTHYYGTANQNFGGNRWQEITGLTLNAGTYYMYATIDETDERVAFTTPAVAFTVFPVTLTPSVASVTGREYNGNTDAIGTLSLSGAVDEQSPTATGTFTWVSANAETTKVNVTNITLDGTWTTNYKLSATSLSNIPAPDGAKISKKNLTVTANAHTIPYGDEPSGGGVSYSGFVTGEDSSNLGGTPGYNYTYEQYGDTGSYSITPKGITSANYNIDFESGTLTVNARPITVTIADKSSVYGAALAKLTAEVTSGSIVNSDSVYTLATGATAQSNVGDYPITGTQTNDNYTVTFAGSAEGGTSGTYSITNASLTGLEVTGYSGTYDGTSHGITVTMLDADIQYGTESGTYNRTDSPTYADVGTYTVYYQVTKTNYTTVTGSATVKIMSKSIAAVWSGKNGNADDFSWVYDGGSHAPTASATGVGGEAVTLKVSGAATNYKASDYTATASIDPANGNYTLTNTTKNFTIAPLTVSLTWSDTTSFVYDGTEKSVTASVNNKVGSDSFNLTYSDNSKTAAGSYTAAVTGLGNDNYTLTNATGTTQKWTIQKAPVSFTVSDNSYTYDAAAHTATVTQMASETPSVIGKFTVTYQKDSEAATENRKDVGEYKIIVTLSDDNFCFAGETAEITRSHTLTDKLHITQNTVTALWKNTSAVYDGTAKSPEFELVGLKTGDDMVTAQLTEGKTDAGTYIVTAALAGANSGNYTLTNPTGTFCIQKAPVSFTITGDSVKKGDSVNVTATPSILGVTATLTYRQNGKQAAVPTNVGSYDIYAEITNSNYRHAGGTDGTAQKIGVLTIYRTAAPAAYTVSFDANGGTGATETLPAAQAGTARVLPDCGFTVNGRTFTGWSYNGSIYQPGALLNQPAANITLTAQWAEDVYAIAGLVDQSGNPLADAVVTLMLGSEQIQQTTTDASGTYRFSNVLPGLYNLVASKNGVTQTILVEIVAENAENQSITMPSGKTNSVVEVAAGSPPIVVGNLEQTFDSIENNPCYGETDQTVVTDGGTVEIKLTAEAVTESESEAAIESKSDGTVGLLLDVTLSKTVIRADGTTDSSASGELEESPMLLQIVINLPGELQRKDSYTVYRVHGGEVHTLTATPNDAGEYIAVNTERTAITVYAKYFSAYAVAYTTLHYSGGGGHTATQPIAVADIPFTDVEASDWFFDDVSYVYENKLMNGTGASVFSPDATTTRGMIVTILYRLDGEPAVSGACPFDDVKVGSYYEKAITWAAQNSIVNGYGGGRFGPDDTITREQLAAILYRFAQFKGYDVTEQEDLSAFLDETDISSYAYEALAWANAEGLVNGVGGKLLAPAETAARAQVAAILHRFCENIVK